MCPRAMPCSKNIPSYTQKSHKRNILLYPNIINTLVRKYALGHCPGPKIYPDIHKSLSAIHIIPFFKIYWWNILLQLLIYHNMINTLVRKYALGQCPAPKIYPHTHKRVFLSCTSYLFLWFTDEIHYCYY